MNNLDDTQQAVIEEARLFVVGSVLPYVSDFEASGGISKELIKKMAAKGYLAASFPIQYGGLGLDPVYYGLFTEVFGKVCMATRSLLTVHTSLVGEALLRFGTEEQKTKWLPRLVSGEVVSAFGLSEPDIGCDARNIKTEWHQENDYFVINGIKKWITFGHIADLFVIIASNGGKSTAFLVERSFPGLETRPITGLMAAKATYLAEVRLDNVKVPKCNVLGKVDYGFEYVISTALDHGRYSIAWAGVAIAQAALEAMVTYSRKRSQFGQKLRNFQLIRGMIGDAVTKVHAARALVLRAGELRKNKDADAIIETTIAKYFASKIAVEVTNDALQVHGGNGITSQYAVERLYREAKILEIIEGSSQMQQEMISSYGLANYYIGNNGLVT